MIQPDTFSKREKEVAELIAQGKSNKQIARQLGIAIRTVEFHSSHIYDKLGVSSRSEAVVEFLKSNLREPTVTAKNPTVRLSTVDSNGVSLHNLGKSLPVNRRSMAITIGSGILLLALIFGARFFFWQSPTSTETSNNTRKVLAISRVGTSDVTLSLNWFYIDTHRVRMEFSITGFPISPGTSPAFLVDQNTIKLYWDNTSIPLSFKNVNVGGSGGKVESVAKSNEYQIILDATYLESQPGITQDQTYVFEIPVGGEVPDADGKILSLPTTIFRFEAKPFFVGPLTFSSEKSAAIEDKIVEFKGLEINPSDSVATLCVTDPQAEQWEPTVHLLYKGNLYSIDHGWWLNKNLSNLNVGKFCYQLPFAFQFDLADDPKQQIAIWVEKLTKEQSEWLPYNLIAAAQNKLADQGIEFQYALLNHGSSITVTRLPAGLTESQAKELIQKALTEEAVASGVLVFDISD
jgi:DNA-binding CsgD family transcriptional regulator